MATLGHAALAWWIILSIIAAGVTIVGGIIGAIKWINEAIKSKEKKLAGLEKSLTKAEKQRDDNVDKKKNLDRLIARRNTLLDQAKAKLKPAVQEYLAAHKAYNAAKAKVTAKTTAYKQAKKTYDDHVYDCYYCRDSAYPCNNGTYLSTIKSNAYSEIREARVSRTFARSRFSKAKSALTIRISLVYRYIKVRDKYVKVKKDLTESHATLLTEIKTLKGQIKAKDEEIKDAKADLDMLKKAKTEAPDYVKSLTKAHEDGLDMKQWVKDNPPPENFREYLEKYYE